MREILTDGSSAALHRVVEDATAHGIAVMCVERAAGHCHRQVITDMSQEMDPTIEVIPIIYAITERYPNNRK